MKKYLLLLTLVILEQAYSNASFVITTLADYSIEAVKEMIIECFAEVENITFHESKVLWETSTCFDDLKDINESYFENNGLFLIVYNGEKIIGSGAIKKIDNQHCELKKLYLLKEYRNMGHGNMIVGMLFKFALKQ